MDPNYRPIYQAAHIFLGHIRQAEAASTTLSPKDPTEHMGRAHRAILHLADEVEKRLIALELQEVAQPDQPDQA